MMLWNGSNRFAPSRGGLAFRVANWTTTKALTGGILFVLKTGYWEDLRNWVAARDELLASAARMAEVGLCPLLRQLLAKLPDARRSTGTVGEAAKQTTYHRQQPLTPSPLVAPALSTCPAATLNRPSRIVPDRVASFVRGFFSHQGCFAYTWTPLKLCVPKPFRHRLTKAVIPRSCLNHPKPSSTSAALTTTSRHLPPASHLTYVRWSRHRLSYLQCHSAA
jgi:hypothetical protein